MSSNSRLSSSCSDGATKKSTCSENTSPRRRVLFYFSFKAKGENEWVGTLLDHLRGKHDLEGCKQWR